MKKYFIIQLVLMILPVTFLRAQKINSYPFESGEKLDFILNYTWGGVVTDVGTATMTLTHSGSQYDVLVVGKTYKFYDMFFKVRERFEASFSDATFRPSRFYREAAEGRYRMKNTLTFNKNHTIKSTTQKYDRPPVDTLLNGTAKTMDLLTLFFHCRTLDFTESMKDKKVPLEFVIDKEIYHIYFTYRGQENKKVPGMGTYKTLKFNVKVVAGNIFDGKEDMSIWISDDQNKVPLFFESPILVGKVQGRLSAMEGQKYPITSKIR